MPSGLRSSMLPRTGKGFPAAAQLTRGIVSKLNSSSEAMSRIWGIRSRERKATHPGAATGQTRDHQSAPHPVPCISVEALPCAQSLKPESQQNPVRVLEDSPSSDQRQSLVPATLTS